MAASSDRPPPQGTVAFFRDKSDDELEDVLRGGGIGNKHVDGALAEINRRAASRQERLTRSTLWAGVIAAIAAIVGAIGAWAALFK